MSQQERISTYRKLAAEADEASLTAPTASLCNYYRELAVALRRLADEVERAGHAKAD